MFIKPGSNTSFRKVIAEVQVDKQPEIGRLGLIDHGNSSYKEQRNEAGGGVVS